MRPIRAGCEHGERRQRLESSHGLGHVLYYKAQKGKDTGSHDVQKPLQEAQRIPPDRTHTHRKSQNKERKSHGSGLTLCCIWMCSEACFNFARWHYHDWHNVTFRDRCCWTVEPLSFFVAFVNYDVAFWVVKRNPTMILSSTNTRARSCAECVHSFPAPSLQYISDLRLSDENTAHLKQREWC